MTIIALDIAILPTKFTNCINNCIYCTVYNFNGLELCKLEKNLVALLRSKLDRE